MSATAKPWRLFAVTVHGFPAATFHASTRGRAMAEAFWRYSEAWPCTFREFLTIARVRSAGMPADDGYSYVRRAYGVSPRIGQRVELRNEGPASGQLGTVLYPGKSSTCYVHVHLDGQKHHCVVHPDNVILLNTTPAQPHARAVSDER